MNDEINLFQFYYFNDKCQLKLFSIMIVKSKTPMVQDDTWTVNGCISDSSDIFCNNIKVHFMARQNQLLE